MEDANWGRNLRQQNADGSAAWYAEISRQRRQRAFQMGILICLMIIFFDSRKSVDHTPNFRGPMHQPPRMSNKEVIAKSDRLRAFLSEARSEKPGPVPALSNISATFMGKFEVNSKMSPKALSESSADKWPGGVRLQTLDSWSKIRGLSPVPSSAGQFALQLHSVPWPRLEELLLQVSGTMSISVSDKTFPVVRVPVQGVFFRQSGRLSLVSGDEGVQLLWPKAEEEKDADAGEIKTTSPPRSRLLPEISEDVAIARMLRDQKLKGFDSLEFIPRNDHHAYREDICSYSLELSIGKALRVLSGKGHRPEWNTVAESWVDKKAVTGRNLSVAQLGWTGFVWTENCNQSLSTTAVYMDVDFSEAFTRATHYAMLSTVLCVLQIYLLLRQLQHSSTQATVTKVSLLSIGCQAILDSYLCLAHLTLGMYLAPVFTSFATVSFFQLIIFSMFEMRYLLMIWRARRPEAFAGGWAAMRRELAVLYTRFYSSLFFGLVLLYAARNSVAIHLIVFLLYSFWVPQIVHSAHRDIRRSVDTLFLVGTSLLRLLPPVYFYAYPANFLAYLPIDYERKSQMAVAIVIWVTLQVIVVLLQRSLGSRFFIPARFLPKKYNYYRKLVVQDNTGESVPLAAATETGHECVICMTEVDVAARDYMIAPCDHLFHRRCLEQWMDIKMECPTCRTTLPPP